MSSSASIDLTSHALALQVKARAREVGFDLVGIASAKPSRHRDYLRRWLDEGQAGSMHYLANRFDERTHPGVYLEGAESVVCVAMNYHVPLEPVAPEARPHQGRVARYALGDDYHEVIKARLYKLADFIRHVAPHANTRCSVDTAPVMERELAARAGIGWVGKNTCVIHPRVGSWILLGEVFTTLALPIDEPIADHCGTCTRCIDACPTGAITAPYQLDARRCVSYLTIEHREEIPQDLKTGIGDWLYGCDICQEVCPHNRGAPTANDPAVAPRFPTGTLDLREVATWDDNTYRTKLRNSAMKRVKLPMLRRNGKVVAENQAAQLNSQMARNTAVSDIDLQTR